MNNSPIKRWFDLFLAIPTSIVCLPVMGLIACMVRVIIGHPILFRQTRPGLYGKPFLLYKFRTMTEKFDPEGELLPDGERLSVFGRFLRSTSLDELPELWNILKGEMSIVGPRPLLMRYLDRYTPEQMRRHDVKPGLTGWAQVSGRNALSWEEKFALDVWYVDHQSLWLDLKIIVMTVVVVFKRQGISQTDHPTMKEFIGTTSQKISGQQRDGA